MRAAGSLQMLLKTMSVKSVILVEICRKRYVSMYIYIYIYIHACYGMYPYFCVYVCGRVRMEGDRIILHMRAADSLQMLLKTMSVKPVILVEICRKRYV
jgi:hypothetical protein